MAAPRTDAELVAASCAGHVSAFSLIVERHQQTVCAVAFSACGDLALSEDIAQDTFVTAWTRLSELREPGRLRGWLCSIARNRARQALRKTRREVAGDEEIASTESEAPSPLDSTVSREEELRLWTALEGIADTYREPLVLFYREGQSLKEVADGLELSIDAVKQRLSRGREALRGKVEEIGALLTRSRVQSAFTVAVIAAVAAKTGVAAASTGAATSAGAGDATAKSGAAAESASATASAAGAGAAFKIALAIAAAAAIAAGLYWFVVRDGGTESAGADDPTASSSAARAVAAARAALGPVDPAGPLTLRGRVVDQDNRPIAGARVTLSSAPVRTAETDGSGQFQFSDLVGKSYFIDAYTDEAATEEKRVFVARGADPVTLQLVRGASLKIQFLDEDTRAPVVGVQVTLRHGVHSRVSRSDASGVARIGGLAGFDLWLEVAADGYGPIADFVELSGRAVEHRRTFLLERGSPLTVSVVDADGAPVTGAKVALREDEVSHRGGRFEVDERGKLRLSAVAPGRYTVVAQHPTMQPARAQLRVAAGAALAPLTLEMRPGHRIRGTVTSASGRAVAGATVRAETASHASVNESVGMQRHAITDDRGEFELVGMSPGTFLVGAVHAEASSQTLEFEVAPTADEMIAPLTLTLRDTAIRGRVVDETGVAVTGVAVMAEMVDGLEIAMFDHITARTTTDERGEFVLGPLAGGARYSLTAMPQGVPPSFSMPGMVVGQNAEAGAVDVVVKVGRPGRITGSVRAPPDVAEYAVAIVPFAAPMPMSIAIPFRIDEGRFDVATPPGVYKVQVVAPGHIGETVARVEVGAGGTADVGTLDIEQGKPVAGIVVDSGGAKVAGARVVLGSHIAGGPSSLADTVDAALVGGDPFAPESAVARSVVSDQNGAFRFADVDLTVPWLGALAEHPRAGRSPVVVVTRRRASGVRLVLGQTGSIEGTVTGTGARRRVFAYPEGIDRPGQAIGEPRLSFTTRVDKAGRYRFDRLAPGRYVLVARDGPIDEFVAEPDAVVVEPNRAAVLDLTLRKDDDMWDTGPLSDVAAAVDKLCQCRDDSCRRASVTAVDEAVAAIEDLSDAGAAYFERIMKRAQTCRDADSGAGR